ncbi:hypothetical protein PMAYCL1PPCAC_25715, partial [Pristionchus mayeri]
LKVLNDRKYIINDDWKLLESVLRIGALYDIKNVIDRVEKSLIESSNLTAAELLLFVDKHDSFRFFKLHTHALGKISDNPGKCFKVEMTPRDLLAS